MELLVEELELKSDEAAILDHTEVQLVKWNIVVLVMVVMFVVLCILK